MRPERRSLLVRLLYATPVLGWLLRDLAEGDDGAFGWFVLFAASALGVATVLFGLAGLVMGMLVMTALTLTVILLVTRG